jgi:hypothetical protein
MDPWEREERLREMSYSRVEPVKRWLDHCPRCQRHTNPAMLSRPHWRTDGPKVCDSCRRWEALWSRVEDQRADRDEHMRNIK